MTRRLRGQGVGLQQDPTRVGLPARPFLYTLDQLAVILSMEMNTLKTNYIFFEGRSTGARSVHLLAARNIAHPTQDPEWRVPERELIRWLKQKGFKVYDLGVVSD